MLNNNTAVRFTAATLLKYFSASILMATMLVSCSKDKMPTINVKNVYSTDTAIIHGICVVNPQLAFAGGDKNLIIRSVDGGNSWSAVNAPKGINATYVIFFTDDKKGFINTDHNYYFTIDGGNSWNVEDSNIINMLLKKYSELHPKTDKYFTDAMHGWQYRFSDIRYYGYINRSTDGGVSWQRINTNQHNRVNDVAFANINSGFAVGQNTILYSNDGGLNWEALRMQDGTSPPVYTALGIADVNTALAIHDGKIDKIFR